MAALLTEYTKIYKAASDAVVSILFRTCKVKDSSADGLMRRCDEICSNGEPVEEIVLEHLLEAIEYRKRCADIYRKKVKHASAAERASNDGHQYYIETFKSIHAKLETYLLRRASEEQHIDQALERDNAELIVPRVTEGISKSALPETPLTPPKHSTKTCDAGCGASDHTPIPPTMQGAGNTENHASYQPWLSAYEKAKGRLLRWMFQIDSDTNLPDFACDEIEEKCAELVEQSARIPWKVSSRLEPMTIYGGKAGQVEQRLHATTNGPIQTFLRVFERVKADLKKLRPREQTRPAVTTSERLLATFKSRPRRAGLFEAQPAETPAGSHKISDCKLIVVRNVRTVSVFEIPLYMLDRKNFLLKAYKNSMLNDRQCAIDLRIHEWSFGELVKLWKRKHAQGLFARINATGWTLSQYAHFCLTAAEFQDMRTSQRAIVLLAESSVVSAGSEFFQQYLVDIHRNELEQWEEFRLCVFAREITRMLLQLVEKDGGRDLRFACTLRDYCNKIYQKDRKMRASYRGGHVQQPRLGKALEPLVKGFWEALFSGSINQCIIIGSVKVSRGRKSDNVWKYLLSTSRTCDASMSQYMTST